MAAPFAAHLRVGPTGRGEIETTGTGGKEVVSNEQHSPEDHMVLGVLSVLIGLSFLAAALIELAGWWGKPIGMAIGAAGTIVSLLLIAAGVAILRSWPRARQTVILAAGSTMIFTSVAGSLNFMGTVAVALGMGLPIALIVGYYRPSKATPARE